MMTEKSDDLTHLRRALRVAEQQQDSDREIIAALRNEISEQQREWQRQVRNILSVVRSVARRSVEEGETAETYQASFDSRLASFTKLQGQIARDPQGGVDLRTLLDGELMAFGIKVDERAHACGVSLCLKPKPASILGLAFHELARLAIEGGASASLDGNIDVRWTVALGEAGTEHLEIVWVETGRQSLTASRPDPAFVREIVEQAVAYEVGGEAQLEVTKDGLSCRFQLPIDCLS